MAKIDIQNGEFKSFKPTPPKGWYDCAVSSVEIKTSPKGNNYADITFVLTDKNSPYGGYESKFNNFFFSDAAIGRLVELIRAANPDYKNNAKFKTFDPEVQRDLNWALVKKPISAYFDTFESEGKDKDGRPKTFTNLKPVKFVSSSTNNDSDQEDVTQHSSVIDINDSDIPF